MEGEKTESKLSLSVGQVVEGLKLEGKNTEELTKKDMNDINKLKELAVPVSERLPEKSNTYTCICDNQLCYLFFAKSNKTWGLDWSKKDYGVTHWIDFDLLTTKAKALELAELAWVGGHKYCEEGRSGQNYYNFLTENQSKL